MHLHCEYYRPQHRITGSFQLVITLTGDNEHSPYFPSTVYTANEVSESSLLGEVIVEGMFPFSPL